MHPIVRSAFARAHILLTFVALFALAGCAGSVRPIQFRSSTESRFDREEFHLGTHRLRPVSCRGAAQQNFDRGLALAYGFNYDAAEKEFESAVAVDSNCAMAWWGIALVNGPHINFPIVPPDRAAKAFKAISSAKALLQRITPLEAALIQALDRRYAENQPEDRSPLDRSYAEAMSELAKLFPDKSDVAALHAEALMDLHPWDFWKADGSPQPWTPEILRELERAIQLNAAHPHAHHLYIHAVEASSNPGKGLASANALEHLVPASGHLVHMPAHIYARVGQWEDAARSNLQSIAADDISIKSYPRPGFYSVYMAHSRHFLAFVRMMQGRSKDAVEAARGMVNGVPEEFIATFGPIVDGYLIFVAEALMRFGKWEEVLLESAPRGNLPLSTALWHYVRAASLTALDRPREATKERALFHKAAAAVPATSTFGNNVSRDITAIASLVLDGEMAAKRKEFGKAIDLLNAAVKKEDALRYDEPPDWIQPVRHTLGGVLLRAKRYKEAEKIYREDLTRYPENGWALFGLARALKLQGQEVAAQRIQERFKAAWSGADVKLESTCFCQQGSETP